MRLFTPRQMFLIPRNDQELPYRNGQSLQRWPHRFNASLSEVDFRAEDAMGLHDIQRSPSITGCFPVMMPPPTSIEQGWKLRFRQSAIDVRVADEAVPLGALGLRIACATHPDKPPTQLCVTWAICDRQALYLAIMSNGEISHDSRGISEHKTGWLPGNGTPLPRTAFSDMGFWALNCNHGITLRIMMAPEWYGKSKVGIVARTQMQVTYK